MVTDAFGSLLEELSKLLKVELKPDKNNTCLINFKDKGKVYLELDRSSQYLILGIEIGSTPKGKYRENIFREALKANGLNPPLNGIFAYSDRSDSLVLYDMHLLSELNGEKLKDLIDPFLAKAKLWQEGMTKGEIPLIQEKNAAIRGTGMFGLR